MAADAPTLNPRTMAVTYAYLILAKSLSNTCGAMRTTRWRNFARLSTFNCRSCRRASQWFGRNGLFDDNPLHALSVGGGAAVQRSSIKSALPENRCSHLRICNYSISGEEISLLKTDASITSKWKFLENSNLSEQSTDKINSSDETSDGSTDLIRNILVCGDGDLSYSAEIAPVLDMLGIQLFASVLEDQVTHNQGMILYTYLLSS